MSTPGKPLILRLLSAVVIAMLASPVLFVQPTRANPPITELVSVGISGQGDQVSRTPSISGNGQIILFASEAINLVDDDTNGAQDIFLHDWLSGDTARLSVN
ncbi:MAG: hypothetical protein MUP44_00850, partial [Anaerolineales bacterium]|nr:hypothetical protein [Anaerolineales bacterium]